MAKPKTIEAGGMISDKRKISITRFQERENSKVKFSFEIYDPILNKTTTVKRIRIEDLEMIKELIKISEKIYKES